MSIKVALMVVLAVLPAWGAALAGEGRWEEPWTAPRPAALPETPKHRISAAALRLFIDYISPVDGDRCPSYPTCSQYGLQAIQKHGPLIGWVMIFDRLIHEFDEVHRARPLEAHGRTRYFDPVENNDFWWFRKKR
ncbi:MAG: membrane protein insertion efficiency factor YidD [Deltaproteobacteria bacterium]|nr:membrane protein insertion efficiency factor YidD [Deltaproteobacteria bacterium]